MDSRPVIVMLHALGGSARAFGGVAAELGDGFEPLALDLPGFGDAANETGYSVAEMVDHVLATVTARAPAQWLIVGHSMGGKIATLVASHRPPGLAGVVLLAASPPAPEPIDEERRATMLGWVAGGPIAAHDARAFVAANVGAPLPPGLNGLAVADVERAAPAAWRAWLETGAREDWSARAGIIDLPALIVAGGADGDLGEAAQRRMNAPHYPDHRVEVLDGVGHLLPLERPADTAALIAAFCNRLLHRRPKPA
ncbi:alpha/beta fold hydrolase [Sphingomonas sp. KR1UV-12]|uniref:Alpha/beta fold hydrolase n=1 Tax=Sphingomonas aurea TaxID=3063994 RepID=A0ABT9ELS1_9SPHN|nr:alpha/beta fold hydrolase [Sphingomonas sp. KR1UV-12]MDP1027899.1 alpha/beta fold hydrolase [Sphingomonas sp. KR1UV-12]